VSVAATFAPLNLAGLSLNIMSLGGLALGIGMLVDSGIVVVESIARCREEGDDVPSAVVRGTSEVGTAVVASTFTTVAVFFPMLIVEGVAGQIFADLALTVVFALLASLLVSVFLVPALTAKVLGFESGSAEAKTPIWRRAPELLRYRSLGPLSPDADRALPRVLSRLLQVVPLLLLLTLVLRRAASGEEGPPGWSVAPAAIAGAVAVTALLVNLVLRPLSTSGPLWRTLGGLRALLIDPVMIALESLWLALLWSGVLIGAPVIFVVWFAGWIARILLKPLLALFDLGFSRLRAAYPMIIRGALSARPVVLVLALAAMGLTLWGITRLDTSLIPEVHQGEFAFEMSLPVGTPLEATLEALEPAEQAANDHPRIERALMKVGADPEGDSEPEEGEHSAKLSALLAEREGDWATLPREIWYSVTHVGSGGAAALREERVIEDLRGTISGIPEVDAEVARPTLFSFRTPIEVEIETYDLATLRRLGQRAERALDELPFLTDVKTTARAGAPEVQIDYDREALSRRGLDLRNVAELVRAKVQGEIATEYRKRERRIDVVARLEEQDRRTVAQLERLIVNPGGRVPIPLSAVADVDVSSGPADIRRVGQRRVALVQASVDDVGLEYAAGEIRSRLAGMDWPSDASWRIGGQVEEMERSTRSLWQALLLSVFFVYVVMAIQFESLLQPLLIMITVPLALVGVALVLWLLSIPLSVVVFLGMIMLAGIVVNNAIVLVDYANQLRERGMSVDDAVVEAGSVRLRPILMTTATTVLGLVPMALGLGDGSEIRSPMAITVIVGLLSSTVLTLIVLPTAYSALERALEGWRQPRREETPATLEGGA
jgi:HAE1 family hydrophobic/amphiphilic exporter-1